MRTVLVVLFTSLLTGCAAAAAPIDGAPSAEPSGAAAVPVADVGPADDDPADRAFECKGDVDGAPYTPVVALGRGFFEQAGRRFLTLELFEREVDCNAKQAAMKGDRQLYLSVPWQGGGKLDLSSAPPDPVMNPNKMKRWDGKRWDEVAAWKPPMGSVLMFETPERAGDKTRVRLLARSGRAKLRGDIPVLLCVDAPR